MSTPSAGTVSREDITVGTAASNVAFSRSAKRQ
jgi:hypothetical protein